MSEEVHVAVRRRAALEDGAMHLLNAALQIEKVDPQLGLRVRAIADDCNERAEQEADVQQMREAIKRIEAREQGQTTGSLDQAMQRRELEQQQQGQQQSS